MNDWPPKPGLTLISSTMSSLSSTWSIHSSGVAGLNTSPALQPESRIRPSVRSTWRDASGWKVITSAPALANIGTRLSTGSTIRCTSIGTFTCGRIASHTSGPMVRFGT
ncbi:MAG: hypothetical protein H6R03_688 [Burkholderiaceae bacterium]|nr:hypothetical protein [Burkholderiaceae bacterium]